MALLSTVPTVWSSSARPVGRTHSPDLLDALEEGGAVDLDTGLGVPVEARDVDSVAAEAGHRLLHERPLRRAHVVWAVLHGAHVQKALIRVVKVLVARGGTHLRHRGNGAKGPRARDVGPSVAPRHSVRDD